MKKHRINPAPYGATGWTFQGVFYASGTEVELSSDLAKEMAARNIIGQPKPEIGELVLNDEGTAYVPAPAPTPAK